MGPPHDVIADNSTLSNFARSEHFDVLQNLFRSGIWTTALVIAEIERGLGKHPSLQSIIDAQSQWLHVIEDLEDAEDQQMQALQAAHRRLSATDASILAVAKERGWTVLTDDNRGGKGMQFVAQQEGVPFWSTLDLLRQAVGQALITQTEMQQIKLDIAAKARFQIKDPDP